MFNSNSTSNLEVMFQSFFKADIHDLARNGKLSELQKELKKNPNRKDETDSVCENILFLFIYFI